MGNTIRQTKNRISSILSHQPTTSDQSATDTTTELSYASTLHSYDNCASIFRLLSCLKQYSSCDITDVSCIDKIYRQRYHILDDFHHLTMYHQHELIQIIRYGLDEYGIDKCQLHSCDHSTRHYRDIENKINEDNDNNNIPTSIDGTLDLYAHTLDSLHFYLFHLFDIGFRSHQVDEEDQKNDHNNQHSQYFDASFSSIYDKIKRISTKTRRFRRLTNIANKYTITMSAPDFNEVFDTPGDTYLDLLLRDLCHDFDYNVPGTGLTQKLKQFILNEEYDTDSVEMDAKMVNGNISMHLQNEYFSEAITYIYDRDRSTFVHVFSLTSHMLVHCISISIFLFSLICKKTRRCF